MNRTENSTFEENLSNFIEFCKVNNRIPLTSGGLNERSLAGFMYRNRTNEVVDKFRKLYIHTSYHSYDENLLELSQFCTINNRLPRSSGNKIESRLRSFLYNYRMDKDVKKIKDKYKSR